MEEEEDFDLQNPYNQSVNSGGRRSSASSAIVTNFRYLQQQRQNQAMSEQSRKKSRKAKGLNPDVPKIQPVREIQLLKGRQKVHQIQKKMDQHKIQLQKLCKRFNTCQQNGLSTQIANQKNKQEGYNKLPQKKNTPKWIKFLKQMASWFAIILWIGAALCIISFVIYPYGNKPNIYLACVLILVILLTGTITYYQSAKSQALMQGFRNMLPLQATVTRDGNKFRIPAQKLARGDLVQVRCQQRIPADIRIIQSIQMRVDNSPLTGQSKPQLRLPQCTHPQQPFLTKNIAFFGTQCSSGIGKGIVIGIGQNTILGQIADYTATQKFKKTPLRSQLDRFVIIISAISITLGIAFFLLAYFVVNIKLLECFVFGVGILVANVPQGLLACITISLAIAAKRLSDKKVLVKNLQSVQTLGSTSCICVDKTGTITQNKMTVQNLWYDGQQIRKGDNKQLRGPDFRYQYQVDDYSFRILHHTAIICSEARFNVTYQEIRSQGFTWLKAPAIGDASQIALIKFFQPIESITQTKTLYKVGKCKDGSESKMPFNSTNKYSLTIVCQQGPNYHWVVYIKGAPEKIWQLCGRILFKGKHKTITNQQVKKFTQVNLKFGKNGERVLGFAMLPLSKQNYNENFQFVTSKPDLFNFKLQNCVFVGLISLMDPPKQNVKESIQKCHAAGIKVIMVTGDQPSTAAAIAKQTGIINQKTNQDFKQERFLDNQSIQKANAVVIHGDMITKIFQESEEIGIELLKKWISKPQICFVRTTPNQKLLIVTACQKAGYIVGVTGDGVNDAPAIKLADIGISMGSGSQITKDVADMILQNDDFSSIVYGIQQGRKIFDNLKKTIVYLLTSNMTEIWPFVALTIFQIPIPLSNIFMLCICVGTDIYPALSLAYEQAEVDIMTRKPRKKTDHLASARLLSHAYGQMGQIATAGGFFTYFVIMDLYGFGFDVIFGLTTQSTVAPNNDVNYNLPYIFNASSPTYGAPLPSNCNQAQILQKGAFPSWINNVNAAYDLRAAYLTCNKATGIYQQLFSPSFYTNQVLMTKSPITGQQVGFTTQSVYYAQSGYFVTVVMIQWSNVFACKSRKTSLIYSGVNYHMFGGLMVQTSLFIFLLYVPGVNNLFGGRPLDFFILGIPGLGFSMLLLCWQESRKALMNMDSNDGKPNWWQRNLLW